MNIAPISFQMTRNNYQIKKNENHTVPSFQGAGKGKKGMKVLTMAALGGCLAGTGIVASSRAKNTETEKTKIKEDFIKRKHAAAEKLDALFLRGWDSPRKPHLYSNELALACRGIDNSSIITPEGLDIIETVVDNEAFSTNQELLRRVIDTIIRDFVLINNKYTGIIYKPDNAQRASRIKLMMEAYLKTPEAQQSEVMQKAIPYLMARAADARPGETAIAFMAIAQPNTENKTYNKEEIDSILYNMDSSPRIFRKELQPEEQKDRLEHARREIDKLDSYRHCKTCFSAGFMAKGWEINSVNLPVVEKFFENNELNQNEKWIEKIPHIVSEINTNIDYFNAEVGKSKAERIMKEMDNYIADKGAHNNDEKTEQYFNNIDEIIYLNHK